MSFEPKRGALDALTFAIHEHDAEPSTTPEDTSEISQHVPHRRHAALTLSRLVKLLDHGSTNSQNPRGCTICRTTAAVVKIYDDLEPFALVPYRSDVDWVAVGTGHTCRSMSTRHRRTAYFVTDSVHWHVVAWV
jgi:hypothetical protein